MIAADTSTWIAFLQKERGPGQPGSEKTGDDVHRLDRALADRQVVMIPPVLTELLSDPALPSPVAAALAEMPEIALHPGYWQRAGQLRAKVLFKHRKARLGDALIAQACLDHNILLLTRDKDFHAFVDAANLHLLL